MWVERLRFISHSEISGRFILAWTPGKNSASSASTLPLAQLIEERKSAQEAAPREGPNYQSRLEHPVVARHHNRDGRADHQQGWWWAARLTPTARESERRARVGRAKT